MRAAVYTPLCQLSGGLVAVSLELGATAGPLGHPRHPGCQAHAAAVPAFFQDMYGLILLMDQK